MAQAELRRRDAARPDLTDAPAGRNSETLEQDMAQAELGRRDAACPDLTDAPAGFQNRIQKLEE